MARSKHIAFLKILNSEHSNLKTVRWGDSPIYSPDPPEKAKHKDQEYAVK